MFKCQLCKQVTSARTKAQRIVLETRSRTYKNPINTYNKHGESYYETTGHETVREFIACPVCAAAYNLQKDKA
ncbi:MAG: hypothetical protein ABI970_21270 [Chloroflexota bacterium]